MIVIPANAGIPAKSLGPGFRRDDNETRRNNEVTCRDDNETRRNNEVTCRDDEARRDDVIVIPADAGIQREH